MDVVEEKADAAAYENNGLLAFQEVTEDKLEELTESEWQRFKTCSWLSRLGVTSCLYSLSS